MSKVQIQIVTWNSKPHLERLFLGIERQQGVNFNILVIDNASTDGTVEWLENYCHSGGIVLNADRIRLATHGDPIAREYTRSRMTIIKNQTNRGFAAAHNQGFAMCEASYVLVLNPDTELRAGYLQEVLRVIESDNKIASVQGKLYRELPEKEKYGIIDSCGLEMKPWSRAVDIGQNSSEKPVFETKMPPLAPHPGPLPKGEGVREVWGVTGACALYRLEALRQVADKHGIFDERFGTYKEDVDLAWRLKRAGWKAVFTPKAFAWHGRGVGKGDVKSRKIRYLSWRNHLLMIWKNLIK